MSHQSTLPHTQEPTRNWPRTILITLTSIVVVLLIGYIIFNQIEKRGDNSGSDSGANQNNNQGIAVGEPNPNGYDCTADKYNCINFTTQSEAQVAFDSCENKGLEDPWNLDKDGDGKVCESLA